MKYCLSILCCLFFTFGALSQVTIGLKVQAGEAWQNYGDDFPIDGFDQRITHYGASIEVFRAVTPSISIGAAPGYMRRGAACEPGFFAFDPIIAPTADATIYTNYIQLPFLAKWQTTLIGRLSAYGQAGAGFAYLVNGYREITFLNDPQNPERRELNFKTDDNNLNRFDFGAQGGLGFAFRVGKGQIQLSGDYYHAFLNMSDSNTSLNRNWSVGLGYAMRVGK